MEAKMLQEQEWLHLLEVVKKESYPVYGEDFEDTVSENYIYCIVIIYCWAETSGQAEKDNGWIYPDSGAGEGYFG